MQLILAYITSNEEGKNFLLSFHLVTCRNIMENLRSENFILFFSFRYTHLPVASCRFRTSKFEDITSEGCYTLFSGTCFVPLCLVAKKNVTEVIQIKSEITNWESKHSNIPGITSLLFCVAVSLFTHSLYSNISGVFVISMELIC